MDAWPPYFVDIIEDLADFSRGDVPLETVGGCLEVYSALPPWKVPRRTDQRQLEEVSALVGAVRDFSRDHNLSFEFELDGTFVGAIDDGDMDESLEEGLLGEWRRSLGVSG
jgi:hypothetical protein